MTTQEAIEVAKGIRLGTQMFPKDVEALIHLISLAKRVSMHKIVDVIVEFMRINKDPNEGFTGNLKMVGIEDINNLAGAIVVWLEKGE